MNSQANPKTSAAPLGVIDTFSAGIATMTRHPWLLLLPILVDLFFWLGPPLVLGPELINAALSPLDPNGPNAAVFSEGLGTTDLPALYDLMRSQLQGLNLWTFLIPTALFWPTLLAGQAFGAGDVTGLAGTAVQVESVGLVLLLMVLLSLVGLWLNLFWLHGVARGLQGRAWLEDGVSLVAISLRHTLRVIGIALLLLAVLLGVLVPLSFGTALVALIVPAVGQVLSSVLMLGTLWGMLWLGLHLYFTVAAVVVADQGVLRAPALSFQIMRRHFWSAIAFIGIGMLLTTGFHLIWSWMDVSAAGRLFGVLGNAMLGTAIAAAMLIFFKERSEVRGQISDNG